MITQELLIEEVAKAIYADWGISKWETLRDSEKNTWRKTAKVILSIPRIARALKLLGLSIVEPQITNVAMDPVTKARLLRADIEQRTKKMVEEDTGQQIKLYISEKDKVLRIEAVTV